jgi:hypothetical protein
MKKTKLILAVALAVVLVLQSFAVAFAAIPTGTVVIGNKAYEIGYANAAANLAEIQAALVNSGNKVYVKTQAGKWVNNSTGAVLTADQITALIPAVTYTNGTTTTAYAAGDTDVPVIGALVATGVTVVDSKSLQVAFDRAPSAAELAAMTFTVKLGDAAQTFGAAVWTGANAKLSSASKLAAGTYTVTPGTAAAVSVVYAGEVLSALAINSTEIKRAADQKLVVVGKNQFGEDITVSKDAITVTAYVTAPAEHVGSAGLINIDDIDAQAPVNGKAIAVGDKVQFTAYLNADTTKVISKVIDVKTPSAFSAITLSNAKLADGQARVTAGGSYEIVYAGLDTDNAAMTLNQMDAIGTGAYITEKIVQDGLALNPQVIVAPVKTPGNTFLVYLDKVANLTVNSDGKLFANGVTEGTATIRITNVVTGKVTALSFTVYAVRNTATVDLTNSSDSVRMGVADKKLAFTLKDQFGVALATSAAEWATSDLAITSTVTSVATVAWDGNEIEVTPAATGTTTIIVTVVTGAGVSSDTLTLTVLPAKAPSSIMISGDYTTALIQGQTVSDLKFKVLDQDGAVINLSGNYHIAITQDDASNLCNATTNNFAATTDGITGGTTVTAENGTATGTFKVKAQLQNDTTNVGSAIEITYTVSTKALKNGALTSGDTDLTLVANAAATGVNAGNSIYNYGYGYNTTPSAIDFAFNTTDAAGNAFNVAANSSVIVELENKSNKAITLGFGGTTKSIAAGAKDSITATFSGVSAFAPSITPATGAGIDGYAILTAKVVGTDSTLATSKIVFYDGVPASTTSKVIDYSALNDRSVTGTVKALDVPGTKMILNNILGNYYFDFNTGASNVFNISGIGLVSSTDFMAQLTVGDIVTVSVAGGTATFTLTNN